MAVPPKEQSSNELRQMELALEEKCGRKDDIDKEQEEAPSDKLTDLLVLGSHVVQQSKD